MQGNAKNGFGLKILRLTGLYAAIAFCVWFCILFYLNGTVVFGDTGASGSADIKENTLNPPADGTIRFTGVPKEAQEIAFSYDGKYCTYMQGSSLIVREIKTGRIVKTINQNGILHPVLMADRNILLYFTRQSGGFTLNTYNMDGDRLSDQAVFSQPADSEVKSLEYSNQTNLLYVNFSRKRIGGESDAVYSVNIMKNVRRASASRVVDNMVLLGKTDEIIYNGPGGSLHAQNGLFGSLQNGRIIGRDEQDRVYVQSPDSASVYVCQANTQPQQIRLKGAPLRFYSDQKGVYAVYAGSLVNLSGQNRETAFSSSLKFLGLGGQIAYFRDTDGAIVGLKLTNG